MREAGVVTVVDSADMAVMGLVEVVKHYRVISSAFAKLKKILIEDPPELLILIDYPGFNLRLAKVAKNAGVKVLYYISPKVWAWKAGRIKTIAARVNHIAVIFPFEVPLYEKAGLPATFVGHPLLDLVDVTMNRDDAAISFGLDPSRKIVGLFPGSRRSEIERILPTILESAKRVQQQFPDVQFVLPLASTLEDSDVLPSFATSGVSATITRERIHDLIRTCDAVISVSGTVTLEVALIGTPMVIIYKLAPLSYALAKRLVKIKHIGLCNIVAGEAVVKELIQHDASPANISAEIDHILGNVLYANEIRRKLSAVRSQLKSGGAAENVARLALSIMASP
jgi:lipid-A-disaccharide synthase